MSVISCNTDMDCSSAQYCAVGEDGSKFCQEYDQSKNQCYRSSDCTIGKWCGKPGKTAKASCSKCGLFDDVTKNALMATKGCNCGSASHCATCKIEEGSTTVQEICDLCVDGYTLSGNSCITVCKDKVMNTETCKCATAQCAAGQVCLINGESGACQDVANPCAYDDNCATCDADGKKCTTCKANYLPDVNGKCQPDANCMIGSPMVSNCIACNDSNKTQCQTCAFGYLLDEVKNTCTKKPCSELIEHCQTCTLGTTEASCIKCDLGFIPDNGSCSVNTNVCQSDLDCTATQYCQATSQSCVDFEVSDTVCYRTDECQAESNAVCGNPGRTMKKSCGFCTGNPLIAKLKGCKCWEAQYCASCTTDGSKGCFTCMTGYSLDSTGKCSAACPIDKKLTEKCACNGVDCEADQLCNADGFCYLETETDSCRIGASKIDNCVECSTADIKLCGKCASGYMIDTKTGLCIKNGTCTVENCDECADGKTDECVQCSDGYEPDDKKQCLELTCMQGSTKKENCLECSATFKTWCGTCTTGYLPVLGSCVVDDGSFCSTDDACAADEYCEILKSRKCVKFDDTEKVCYKTEQCVGNNKVCGNPGTTWKSSCGKCTNYSEIAAIKGCRCGDSIRCAECDSKDNTKCFTCMNGYHLANGECLKDCKTDIVIAEVCSCGTDGNCAIGSTCKNVSGALKCVSDANNNCIQGQFAVLNCSKCDSTTITKCSECAAGYTIDNVHNVCDAINNCQYGDNKIDNCKTCDSKDKFVCAACKKNFKLTDGKCKSQGNNTGLIIGIVVAAVVVIIVAIVIAVMIIRKRKNNGAVATNFNVKKDRSRDVAPEEVHIPI